MLLLSTMQSGANQIKSNQIRSVPVYAVREKLKFPQLSVVT